MISIKINFVFDENYVDQKVRIALIDIIVIFGEQNYVDAQLLKVWETQLSEAKIEFQKYDLNIKNI